MPQTLLSLAALVAAAFFTLGQKQASTHTMQSIVRDEFEVAVSGALLQTTEFADSRAFDEATTPARLRLRLGLPPVLTQAILDTLSIEDVMVPVSDFAAPNAFGRDPAGNPTLCDPKNQLASVGCNDVSDFNDVSPARNTWRNVTLETPTGEPLPVEVRTEVYYVEAARPDVKVNFRTNHKRVDVYARSPVLARLYPGTDYTIQMNRVISFDPAVALEYLGRSTCIVGAGNAAQVSRLQAAVDAAQALAAAARARVTATAAAILTAQATVTQRATEAVTAAAAVAPAQAAVTTAQTAAALSQTTATLAQTALQTAQTTQRDAQSRQNEAQSARTAAQAEVARLERELRNSSGLTRWWIANVSLPNAQRDETDAQSAYNTAVTNTRNADAEVTRAQTALTTAQQNAATAQQNVARAQQAVTDAQQASANAQQASANAQQALAAARADAAAAVTAAAEADRTLAAAIAALEAFSGGCRG